jgi:hypothetical protein
MHAHAHPSRVLDEKSHDAVVDDAHTALHIKANGSNVATYATALRLFHACQLWNETQDTRQLRRVLLELLASLDA